MPSSISSWLFRKSCSSRSTTEIIREQKEILKNNKRFQTSSFRRSLKWLMMELARRLPPRRRRTRSGPSYTENPLGWQWTRRQRLSSPSPSCTNFKGSLRPMLISPKPLRRITMELRSRHLGDEEETDLAELEANLSHEKLRIWPSNSARQRNCRPPEVTPLQHLLNLLSRLLWSTRQSTKYDHRAFCIVSCWYRRWSKCSSLSQMISRKKRE